MRNPSPSTPRWIFCLLFMGISCSQKNSRPDLRPPAFDINEAAVPLSMEESDQLYAEVSQETLKACEDAEIIDQETSVPSRDQGISGLCAGFSSLQLVEQNQLSRGNWSEPYSILDYVSLNNSDRSVPFSSGLFDTDLLNELQNKLELRSEASAPFPLEFFQEETKLELKKYYETKTLLKEFDYAHYSVKIPADILEKADKANTNFKDFLNSIYIPLSGFTFKNIAEVKKLKLFPFNYSQKIYFGSDINLTLQSLFKEIKNKRGVRYGLCGIHIPGGKQRATDRGYPVSACGNHGVTLLNTRKREGRCEVLMSNSWGKNWGINGKMWIDLKSLLAATPKEKQSNKTYLDLMSIESADANNFKKNHYLLFEDNKKTYETRGISDANGNITDGSIFFTNPDGSTKEEIYENGVLKNP